MYVCMYGKALCGVVCPAPLRTSHMWPVGRNKKETDDEGVMHANSVAPLESLRVHFCFALYWMKVVVVTSLTCMDSAIMLGMYV